MELVALSSEELKPPRTMDETSEEGVPHTTGSISAEMRELRFFECCTREEMAATRRRKGHSGTIQTRKGKTGRIDPFFCPFFNPPNL